MAINYQGKIRLTQGALHIIFDKVNVSIVAEKISKEYESIRGDFVSIIKGYKYSAKIDLFLLNSDTSNPQKLNQLLFCINALKVTFPIVLNLYASDGSTILASIPFQSISSDIQYTDYLSQNAKIGLKFSFELETLSVVSKENLLNGW